MSVRPAINRQWRCVDCRWNASRSLSTTAARCAVGAEHPRYINIPEPPQHSIQERSRIKGALPVPRQVFRGKRRTLDNMEQSLEKATLEPASPSTVHPTESRAAYNARMTEIRRRNLREGVRELNSRMRRANIQQQNRSDAMSRTREAAVFAPEREDDRLTATSSNIDLRNYVQFKRSPAELEELLQASRKRTAKHLDKRHQARLDDLHSLYTKAESFIVDETALDEAIDKAFGTDEEPVTFQTAYGVTDSHSIWSLGRPDNLATILSNEEAKAKGRSRSSVDPVSEKINRMAEVLTGGELPKDNKEKSQ